MPFLPDVMLIGSIPIGMSALTGLLGLLIAYTTTTLLARRRGESPEPEQNLLVNIALGGLVGAKLLYVFLDPLGYWRNPLALLLFPTGPWALPGGIVGAAVAGVWSLRSAVPQRLTILDHIAWPLTLGLAVATSGWHEPGSWSFTPALVVTTAIALAIGARAKPPGHQAALTLIVACTAVSLADIARPAQHGLTSLQVGAALTATLMWWGLRRRQPHGITVTRKGRTLKRKREG